MNIYKFFKNKKVIVTGHTGFKGSWLVAWLDMLGCNVMGISLDPNTGDNHFKILKKNIKIIDHRSDIRNEKSLKRLIIKFSPSKISIVLNSLFWLNAICIPSIIACSISAPENPFDFSLN